MRDWEVPRKSLVVRETPGARVDSRGTIGASAAVARSLFVRLRLNPCARCWCVGVDPSAFGADAAAAEHRPELRLRPPSDTSTSRTRRGRRRIETAGGQGPREDAEKQARMAGGAGGEAPSRSREA